MRYAVGDYSQAWGTGENLGATGIGAALASQLSTLVALDATVLDDQHHEHHRNHHREQNDAFERGADEDDARNGSRPDDALTRLGSEGPPHREVHTDQE